VTFLLKQMPAGSATAGGLPVGLHPLYVSRWHGDRLDAWRRKYAPIMGLLSVAREPFRRSNCSCSRQEERDVSDALVDLGFIEGRICGGLPAVPSIGRRFSPGAGFEVARGNGEEPVLSPPAKGIARCRVLHAGRPGIVVAVESLRLAVHGIPPCPR
jgi:hypothetical protein